MGKRCKMASEASAVPSYVFWLLIFFRVRSVSNFLEIKLSRSCTNYMLNVDWLDASLNGMMWPWCFDRLSSHHLPYQMRQPNPSNDRLLGERINAQHRPAGRFFERDEAAVWPGSFPSFAISNAPALRYILVSFGEESRRSLAPSGSVGF